MELGHSCFASLNDLKSPMHLTRPRGRIVEACGQQFADRPNVIRQPLRNRRRDAQSLMDATEIEMGDEQADRRKMVIRTLAEAVR